MSPTSWLVVKRGRAPLVNYPASRKGLRKIRVALFRAAAQPAAMKLLEHEVAIITGASRGIGRAAALLFAAEGAAVVVGARGEAPLFKLCKDIADAGGSARALAGDVSDETYARALVALAVTEFGGLDVAFNNAATFGPLGDSTAIAAHDWRKTLDVNLTSAHFAAKHQLPAMLSRGGGSLIFTSSFVGHTAAFPGMAAYAASKAGLVGLTQALAVEFGARGVRVNALLPGATDTEMAREFAPTPAARAAVANLNALKRMAAPSEIAQVALFLASGMSSFVTGTALLADGGVSINRG
jgi:NAD(P)-dependent dehydrogenase (short-subunit alcohol dehydrogenase family)